MPCLLSPALPPGESPLDPMTQAPSPLAYCSVQAEEEIGEFGQGCSSVATAPAGAPFPQLQRYRSPPVLPGLGVSSSLA